MLLLLRIGTRLAPDRTSLGPFTELEKAEAAGLLLAYGQLAMKSSVSRQLKQALALLLLVVTWLALFYGALIVFWFPNCVLGACHLGLGPVLRWGLRSWCSIAGASWSLEAVLLAGLAFQEFTLVFFSFFSFGLWRNHPKLLGPGALIFVAKQL